jgi:Mg2+/Co2+ transporter CorB
LIDAAFWITSAAILVLLVLSAFFSGSETALTAASRARMHQLEKDGNRRARTVNRLRDRKERLIGALLLGNNLVNILASALATSVLLRLFGDAGIAYATLGMTLLVLIFSEVLPKTYALNHADGAALALAPLVRVVVAVLSPFTALINLIVRGILGLFGAKPVDGGMAAIEELRGAIELHGGTDRRVREQRAMLRSILDLGEVPVADVMVHRRNVATVDLDQPVDAIIDQVLASPYTRLPVWRDEPDNVVGVLHAKALLREVRARRGKVDGLDIAAIAAPPIFVPDGTSLLEQLRSFRENRAHMALVVDEYGSLMGIVTLEDILEEIVGDIYDEHDRPLAGVAAGGDGSYLVEGWVTLRDLNRQFDWDLPDDEAATIAGLVMFEAEAIPQEGEEVEVGGVRIRVEKRVRHQLTQLRVRPPQPRTGDEG